MLQKCRTQINLNYDFFFLFTVFSICSKEGFGQRIINASKKVLLIYNNARDHNFVFFVDITIFCIILILTDFFDAQQLYFCFWSSPNC